MDVQIKALNRQILSNIETEFEVLYKKYPELKSELQDSYARIRKNILDIVGNYSRNNG
jgi:hypothetical protein